MRGDGMNKQLSIYDISKLSGVSISTVSRVLNGSQNVNGQTRERVEAVIRKYGYVGRENVLKLVNDPANGDLKANLSVAAHLIHGSSDGRFTITYCTKLVTEEEVRGVGFEYAPYDEMAQKYDPAKLKDGWNTVDGEEIFYISNPALGLWTVE